MILPIELALEVVEGIVDCRIETWELETGALVTTVTILYPHQVNGRIQSKVYEHNLNLNQQTGLYYFAADAPIHPKVLALEGQIAAAMREALL
jgi:hypothetical protein